MQDLCRTDPPQENMCYVEHAGYASTRKTELLRIYMIQIPQIYHEVGIGDQSGVWNNVRKRYSSCRYNERQLIHVAVVRRVRPRAERSCDTTTH